MQITCDFPDNVLPIGTKVFIPRPAINSVTEDEIRGYTCIMHNFEDRTILTPTDYQLNTINLGRDDSLSSEWKSNEIFLSYEEAKAFAVYYPVTATPEEWMAAIGLNGAEDEERIHYNEECELEPCCATISAIRNILYEACTEGRIDAVTRHELVELINGHPLDLSNSPNLTKILTQLNINLTNGNNTTIDRTNNPEPVA